jgi:hypothetical protein
MIAIFELTCKRKNLGPTGRPTLSLGVEQGVKALMRVKKDR